MLVLPALACGIGLGGTAAVADTEAGALSNMEGGIDSDGIVSSTGSDGSALDAAVSFGDAAHLSSGDATFVSGARCKAGDYTGTFTCLFQLPGPPGPTAEAGPGPSGPPGPPGPTAEAGAGPNVMVTGPVTLTLSPMSSGILTVAAGSVSGTAVGSAIMFTATMQGQLDCATGQFVGQLMNGMYMGAGPLGFFITGSFQVSLTATYDDKTYTFVNGATGGGCIGNPPSEGWSATYCGPAGSCGPG